MLTTAPPPCSRNKGAAALVQRNGPVRLTSSTRLQSSSEVSSSGANTATPALLTSASSRPNRRSIQAMDGSPAFPMQRYRVFRIGETGDRAIQQFAFDIQ